MCKTLFIIYLQTYIRRNFHGQNHGKLVYFSSSWTSLTLDRLGWWANNYTTYTCARFGFCFKFLTLLVFQTSGKQKSEKLEKCQKFLLLEKICWSPHSVDHCEILTSLNFETSDFHVSPQIFFDFLTILVFDIYLAVKKRYGKIGKVSGKDYITNYLEPKTWITTFKQNHWQYQTSLLF